MARRMSNNGIRFLKGWEGRRGAAVLRAYLDGGGVPTIGYGHTRGVSMGMTCSEQQAERWLVEDVRSAEAAVDSLVKIFLSDTQFDVLVSFVFNVGITAFAKSTLLRMLNAGNFDAVPSQLMRWCKDRNPRTGKLEIVPGLQNRRAAEVVLWNTTVNGESRHLVAATSLRPAAPPAPTKLLQTSTGKAQTTALVAGGGAAAIDVASKSTSFMSGLQESLDHLQGIATMMQAVQYILVGGTLLMIGWTLWERRKRLKETGS